MADYIDREKIFSIWRSMPAPASVTSLAAAISQTPAADVAPVRHGRWMTTDAYPHHLYCSVCYKTYAKNAKWVNELDLPTNYCPNCGALMREEAREAMGVRQCSVASCYRRGRRCKGYTIARMDKGAEHIL